MASTREGGGGAIGSGFIRNKRGSHEFQWNEECCCFVRSLDMSVVVVGGVASVGRSVGKKSRLLPSVLRSQVGWSKTLL